MIIFQLLSNIFVSAALFFIISQSINYTYTVTKVFNISHAIYITLGAYFTFLFSVQLSFPVFISILLTVFFVALIGSLLDLLIYRPLFIKKNTSFTLLIVSLGIYIIMQNVISLIWGDEIRSIRTSEVTTGNYLLGAYITDIQIITIIVGIVLFISTIIFYHLTILGRQMKAVASNLELASIFGINSNTVILWSTVIGSALAAIAGILTAFDSDLFPTMGFNLLLYGIIAMIVGGASSIWGLGGGALLLSAAQNIGAYYFDGKWMDAIAYLILIFFLILKPFGFTGQRMKKIEI